MKSLINAAVSIALVFGLFASHSIARAQDSAGRYVDAQGREVTVHSGQAQPDNYGPKPDFAQLDRNHDGFISREEAEAYPPLINDFDYLAHGAARISARQYAQWEHH